MAQAIVHRLEAIHIYKEDCCGPPAARGAGKRVLQPIQEQRSVGQVGEGIMEGSMRKLLLKGLALGDIAEYPTDAHRAGVFEAAVDTPSNNDAPAVRGKEHTLQIGDLLPTPRTLEGLCHKCDAVRMDHVEQRHPHHVLRTVSQDVVPGTVRIQQAAVGIGALNQVVGAIQKVLQSGLALPQGLLGTLALSYIVKGEHRALDSIRASYRRRRISNGYGCAITANERLVLCAHRPALEDSL